jgi:hypothetical protein
VKRLPSKDTSLSIKGASNCFRVRPRPPERRRQRRRYPSRLLRRCPLKSPLRLLPHGGQGTVAEKLLLAVALPPYHYLVDPLPGSCWSVWGFLASLVSRWHLLRLLLFRLCHSRQKVLATNETTKTNIETATRSKTDMARLTMALVPSSLVYLAQHLDALRS